MFVFIAKLKCPDQVVTLPNSVTFPETLFVIVAMSSNPNLKSIPSVISDIIHLKPALLLLEITAKVLAYKTWEMEIFLIVIMAQMIFAQTYTSNWMTMVALIMGKI